MSPTLAGDYSTSLARNREIALINQFISRSNFLLSVQVLSDSPPVCEKTMHGD